MPTRIVPGAGKPSSVFAVPVVTGATLRETRMLALELAKKVAAMEAALEEKEKEQDNKRKAAYERFKAKQAAQAAKRCKEMEPACKAKGVVVPPRNMQNKGAKEKAMQEEARRAMEEEEEKAAAAAVAERKLIGKFSAELRTLRTFCEDEIYQDMADYNARAISSMDFRKDQLLMRIAAVSAEVHRVERRMEESWRCGSENTDEDGAGGYI
ncbi:unnamed protein product [Effrenium voratum]|nr:unnamed protein product [Effrenium voratum]